MARIIGEIRPKFAFMENSPKLTFRGLGRVLGDLSELGYDARWGVVGAHHVGAPHRRERIWILANACSFGLCSTKAERKLAGKFGFAERCLDANWWIREPQSTSRKIEPDLGRVAHGVAARVDRLKAIGNGQVPLVAALAFQILGGKLK
jgi:DNA (cytosine-5)-methyltransferase 1